MIYPGNRCFLQKTDTLRDDCVHFPNKKHDKNDPPVLKTTAYISAANAAYTATSSSRDRCVLAQKNGCKGSYALQKLPLHDRILSTPVDPMHLIKNIAEHCVRLLTGVEDSLKVRNEEKSRGRFKAAWVEGSTSTICSNQRRDLFS